MLTLLLALFSLIIFFFEAHNPIWRIGIFLLLALFISFKNKIDQRLWALSKSYKICQLTKFIAIAFIILRLFHGAYRLHKTNPNMEDIAHVHLRAFDTFFIEHKNPYNTPLDHYLVGEKDYAGLKYPPLGLFYYAPFIAIFKDKGIYGGNFLLYFLAAFLLAKELLIYSRFHQYLGIILFLSSDFYFRLALNRGTNDFLPTILMLLGFLALRNNRPNKSGIYFGLSLLTKPLPVGLLLFILIWQKKIKPIILATLILVIGLLPFMIWDARAFFENVIVFNLLRPVRENSILINFSHFYQQMIPLVGLVAIAAISYAGKFYHKLNINKSYLTIILAFFIFLITSKMTPYHYFVWPLPFLILYFLIPEKESSASASAKALTK